jgi:DNA-binding NarL/FixJ family response regulator
MSEEHRVRVGVVATDPLRCMGLQTILEESAGLVTCTLSLQGAAENLDVAAVVIDSAGVLDLPELLARLRRERPMLRAVVVGESNDAEHIQEVIRAGAKGYLAATANESEIRMAMDVVLDGSVWAPRKVLARLLESGGVRSANGPAGEPIAEQLTPRENTVLELLMEGRSNRQIAEAMGIDPVTVKAHLGRMLRKAGVKNRVELTLRAIAERMET